MKIQNKFEKEIEIILSFWNEYGTYKNWSRQELIKQFKNNLEHLKEKFIEEQEKKDKKIIFFINLAETNLELAVSRLKEIELLK